MSSSLRACVIRVAQFLFPLLAPAAQRYRVPFLLCSVPLKRVRRGTSKGTWQQEHDAARLCNVLSKGTQQRAGIATAPLARDGFAKMLLHGIRCSAEAGPGTPELLEEGGISSVFNYASYERLGAGKFVLWLHTAKPALEKGLLMPSYHLASLCPIKGWHNSSHSNRKYMQLDQKKLYCEASMYFLLILLCHF